MPPLPLPPEIDEFLRLPNPAVVASLRSDGSPHTVATWYLWDGERLLLNMDESRLRLRFMRRDPRVALTALGDGEWYRHASLLGEVAEIREDDGLADIDRLAVHYTGSPFRNRSGQALQRTRRAKRLARVERLGAWLGGSD